MACKPSLLLSLLYSITLFEGLHSLELTILHTNDVHTRFEQTDQYGGKCTAELESTGQCFGGVSRRMTKLKEIRSSIDNTLLLDAGDQFQGTIWYYAYQGNATAHFMNLLRYDAMAIGNHEFDNGIAGLTPFLQNISFPALSCNIDSSKEPEFSDLYVCTYVLTLPKGERIGIVGYTLQSTPDYAKTGELVFNSELGGDIQQGVDSLIEGGIDKIIALGHSGIETDIEIAKSIRGIDIVIGGHTNTFLYTGNPPSNEVPFGEYPLIYTQEGDETSPVLVVSASAYGKYLGQLDVKFDDKGVVTEFDGNPILLDKNVEQDPETLSAFMEWKVAVDKIANEVVGQTYVKLEGDYNVCGTRECNNGNVLADAMVYNEVLMSSSASEGWSEVSIAMTTSGSIRGSIESGSIIIDQLISVMPYGNSIDKVQLKGEDLLKVLEIAVEGYEDGSPISSFLQVSGLRITYDVTRLPGDRVLSVMVKCSDCQVPSYAPLNVESVYTVLMNTYMAGGGGGFSYIKEHKLSHTKGLLDVDVTINYLRAVTSIATGEEGRIVIYSASDPAPCYSVSTTPVQSILLLIGALLFMRLGS